MFVEGKIECVEELLKPANRVLKTGMSVKHEVFERRVELWNKIKMNYDSYLDENCGTFLKDLDQYFCSRFDGALLVLAASFKENKEFFGAANIFNEKEIILFLAIDRYNYFEIHSVDDIRKKLIQRDKKVLDLLQDYYVYMDSWVNMQLEDPEIRLTIRYYHKNKWDGYKRKINEAVSSLVMELDWLGILIHSWEQEELRRKNDEEGRLREEKEVEYRKRKEIEEQERIRKQQEETAQNIEEIKRKAQEEADGRVREQEEKHQKELRRLREEEEKARKERDEQARLRKQQEEEWRLKKAEEEKAREDKTKKDRMREEIEEAFAKGKGTRYYVKLEEVKQYELNFIGRLDHRLGDKVTFSGKTYRVEDLKETKQVDTSYLGEKYKLSEKDRKNLPENRVLVGSLTEDGIKALLWKKQRYYLKALFFAREEKFAVDRYDTEPIKLDELNICLAETRDEAKEKKEWILLCLASPTGFEDAIVERICNNEDFNRNFLSRYLSVCLIDLGTGKQLYNPYDGMAKEFAKLCELETNSEKTEKLKLSIRKTIEEGLLLKDFVVFEDVAKDVGSDPFVKQAFYDYADDKGLEIRFVEDVGLVMMK